MSTCSFVLEPKITHESKVIEVIEALQMKYVLSDIQLVSNALVDLHPCTGCDTVIAFSCKVKVKPLKLMMKNEKYITTVVSIGKEIEISTSSFNTLAEFFCVMVIMRIPLTMFVTGFTH